MTAWRNLPSALPPHGTVLAWARGCRCEECEREYQRFVSELAPLRFPAAPAPRKFPEGWAIGQPDKVLSMKETFTIPAQAPKGGVPYQHFVLDTNFDPLREVHGLYFDVSLIRASLSSNIGNRMRGIDDQI